MIRKSLTGLLGLVWATTASADWELNMPRGVTELSAETYKLHMMGFWICTAIGIVVFGVMFVSLVLHRKSRGVVPAKFQHSTTVEFAWTIVPVFVLLAMVIPTAETLIEIEDTRDPDLTVVVTGYQWKWHYDYLDQDVAFYSSLARPSLEARQKDSGVDPYSVENYLLEVDNPVVVPVGAKVRILLTSNDVVHSWWVPELAMKKDAIPGMVNEIWFRAEAAGTYRGQCAELCGKDHGYMPVVVEVVEQGEFDEWVAANGGNTETQHARNSNEIG